ncbi:MAG TPA: Gfo/Idh/MocA family oxidoreductase [Candidatus Avimonas sp.]|nr:Gfo/Idh/MocA family oxidoreductase [Candidatus Avimonas sp.]HQA16139.1 Gfo/Idh/MocA family oxidoreductase [Candidatus Avimonas sp.]HQD38224.1 Gfo/Idh/MocA family oxidoreductase [Candidatus Avimonas sp.]
MEKIRLGIIGIGNMGTAHINNILSGKCPEIEVAAVEDINPARLKWAEENLPKSVGIFDDAEAMLDSGLIDSALIAVPHYDHPRYAIDCMRRGIHVMVEKPAGVYTKQVREMNEFAKKSDVVFGMMFNQRTDHIYRKMHQLVHSGELGQIRRTSWIITNWYRPQAYYDSGAWRATWAGEGGGVLLNQCPHNLDLWQWICGMPVKVYAHMHFGKWHDIEVEDDVTAYVEYANGATGTFITSTGDTPGTNRFEILLDKGKLVSENGKLYMWKLEQSEPEFRRTCDRIFAQPKAEFFEVETDGKSEQHVGVLNAFAGAVLRGTPLIANGEEGINGLLISNAMHLSAWLKKEIEIPFDEDLFYRELMKRVKTSRRKQEVKNIVADTSGTYNV